MYNASERGGRRNKQMMSICEKGHQNPKLEWPHLYMFIQWRKNMNVILVPVLCWQYLGRKDEEKEIIKVLINLSLEFEGIVCFYPQACII